MVYALFHLHSDIKYQADSSIDCNSDFIELFITAVVFVICDKQRKLQQK